MKSKIKSSFKQFECELNSNRSVRFYQEQCEHRGHHICAIFRTIPVNDASIALRCHLLIKHHPHGHSCGSLNQPYDLVVETKSQNLGFRADFTDRFSSEISIELFDSLFKISLKIIHIYKLYKIPSIASMLSWEISSYKSQP